MDLHSCGGLRQNNKWINDVAFLSDACLTSQLFDRISTMITLFFFSLLTPTFFPLNYSSSLLYYLHTFPNFILFTSSLLPSLFSFVLPLYFQIAPFLFVIYDTGPNKISNWLSSTSFPPFLLHLHSFFPLMPHVSSHFTFSSFVTYICSIITLSYPHTTTLSLSSIF